VGEVAGTLAAYCLRKGLNPRQVRNDRELLESFLYVLTSQGVELEWPKPGTFESNTEEYRREHSIPLNLRT
jgi:hypothetical protein